MKKLVLLSVAILSTSLGSYAFVDNQYMTTSQYMVNTGYSSEMERMMAVTNQDPYREPHTAKSERTPADIAKKIYNYIAPGMYTDYDFYNHNINNNTIDWRDF